MAGSFAANVDDSADIFPRFAGEAKVRCSVFLNFPSR
jgi:hypothetical protein